MVNKCSPSKRVFHRLAVQSHAGRVTAIRDSVQRGRPQCRQHPGVSVTLTPDGQSCCTAGPPRSPIMESSDEETLSERSYVSGRSLRSERSGGSLSPCPSGPQGGPAGSTLPWNLAKHERRKRKSQDSVLDPAERAVVRVAG
ncbi:unnamed protein product [Gadus morhua 'NCC']